MRHGIKAYPFANIDTRPLYLAPTFYPWWRRLAYGDCKEYFGWLAENYPLFLQPN